MRKYPNVRDIQNKISSEGTSHITFHAKEWNDVIHSYSVPGYEYLSGGFVEFLDRFRTILPEKEPIVLEITGKQFTGTEKETIDRAIWTHYGLCLSEVSANLKKTRVRMIVFFILMVLSSSLLFLVAQNSSEVILNYGYVLFWFFGYRVLIHLSIDYRPIYKEYQWYRRLSSLKLVFSDDADQSLVAEQISREASHYAREADSLTKKHRFVEQVLLEDSYVSLGCSIRQAEDVLFPSGAGDMEIVSDEMADYLLSALPFINQKAVTKLKIEGGDFSEEEQNRISAAIRNYLAFVISEQDAEQKANKGISIFFGTGLLISTLILYALGKNVDLAVHEFILVMFWFFADYLLDFITLSRMRIRARKKMLEKLANMDISFEGAKENI